MTLNDERRAYLRRTMAVLDRVPNGMWVEIDELGIAFQGHTQTHAAEIRTLFPGVFWDKKFVASCEWWEYSTEFDGVRIRIYAVSEAPASCKAIEEEYEEVENVPVQFERRRVTKKRIRWDCSGGIEVQP